MPVRRASRAAVVRLCALAFTFTFTPVRSALAAEAAREAAPVPPGNAIVDWNTYLLGQVVKDDNRNPGPPGSRPDPSAKGDKPPMVSRQLAMIHVAMFNAVNAVEGKYQSYGSPRPAGFERANAEVAAIHAAHGVALSLFDNERLQARIVSKLNTDLADARFASLDDQTKRLSEQLGKLVARQVIEMRAHDGCDAKVEYQDDAPKPGSTTSCKSYGHYRMDQFSDGAQVPCAAPQWPKVKPFVLPSGSEFRTSGPPACSSAAYAAAVEELRQKGGRSRYFELAQYEGGKLPKDVAFEMRTAFFWAEKGLAANGTKTQAGTVTPPGHWNEIATVAIPAAGKKLSLSETARLYAALNLAMADAAVAAWDMKYQYDLWRPIHAIRLAPSDPADPHYNAGITADAKWLPLIPTSNHPEYTSGHSTFSGAAAAVLSELLGEGVRFTVTSDDALKINADGLPDEKGAKEYRTFANFWDAAREAGRSRIYGGIHYQFSNEDGLRTGERVGQYVLANALRPSAAGAGAGTDAGARASAGAKP